MFKYISDRRGYLVNVQAGLFAALISISVVQAPSAMAQNSNNTPIRSCGLMAARPTDDPTITLICNIPYEATEEMMRLVASNDAAEFDKVLTLAKAYIPETSRLKAATFRSFLQALAQYDVNGDALQGSLTKIVRHHLELEDRVATIRFDEPTVQATMTEVAKALAADPPQYDAAWMKLDDAENKLSGKRTREMAQVYGLKAGIEAARLNRPEAAAFYERAALALPEPDKGFRHGFMIAAATELLGHGLNKGDNAALLRAATLYNDSLPLAERAPQSLELADTLNNLGYALQMLGERESDTAWLGEAVVAYRAALQEYTLGQQPFGWGITQQSLGLTLSTIGSRQGSVDALEEAVVAYRAALKELTRERVPLDWADTQVNLGAALSKLGSRESDNRRLEEAVIASRAALEELVRENAPLTWAKAQYNLGFALQEIGSREGKIDILEQAVAAYRAALQESTHTRAPLDWATTQNNLANALTNLSSLNNNIDLLVEAVVAHRAAMEEITRERNPFGWAAIQANLGTTLWTLGERESGVARLEEAVVAYRAAMEEFTRERAPRDWQGMQEAVSGLQAEIAKRK